MFKHSHPYPPFIPYHSKALIVGTIPPPRFSTGELFEEDVDFCYGSKYGLLWPIMNRIFDLQLEFKNTQKSINQRKAFLERHKIGICDIVESCERKAKNASDLGMYNIQMRNLLYHIQKNPSICSILFMGGNSKNGPEYLFRKHLKSHKLALEMVSNDIQKIHHLHLGKRTIQTVSLISPSNAANRSIGANPLYKSLKLKDNSFTTFDFRYMIYKKYFYNV